MFITYELISTFDFETDLDYNNDHDDQASKTKKYYCAIIIKSFFLNFECYSDVFSLKSILADFNQKLAAGCK